ncbi:MAG: 4-hydroxythreonine-4-phosphate dehydrogenase PdxA [Caldilineaceae bacterium]
MAKVLAEPSIYALCAPFVIGHPAVLEAAGALVGSALTWRSILALAEARFEAGTVDVLCPAGLEIGEVPVGRVDAAMGKAAALCLETAYALAQAGQVQGVAAAPMNKDAFHRAGYHYYDELAWLAAMTQSPEPFLVGVTSAMWTVTVTEHIPFKEIAEHIRQDRILDRTRKLYNVLVRVGFAEPRIAVAALNPHAGESGLFGREEIDEIAPAVRAAQQDDINAEGPIPADAVFVRTQPASLTVWSACTTIRPILRANCSPAGRGPRSLWGCRWSAVRRHTARRLILPGKVWRMQAACVMRWNM